jgi:uncharacterized membrane protein YdjX (TVP38/TMEM64 family)
VFFLKGLLGGIWGYLVAAGAAVLGVFLLFQKGKTAGQNEVIVEKVEKEIENVKVAQQVERRVAVEQPGAVQQRLRDKYGRG